MTRYTEHRLNAIVSGNFDKTLFTNQSCSVWIQFWAYAPYSPKLARLHMLNKSRVRSNLRAELKQLLPAQSVETARTAIQSYMDGIWLHAAQSDAVANADVAQVDATLFLRLLLRGSVQN